MALTKLLLLYHWHTFFGGLEFELRALCLQNKCFTVGAIPPPVHFVLVILEMGSLELIYSGWPRILILPISPPKQQT
jgi:hypothetical protein